MITDTLILLIRAAFAVAFLVGVYLLAAAWVRVVVRERMGKRVRV